MQLSRTKSWDQFFVEFEKCICFFVFVVVVVFFPHNCVRMALVGVAALLTVLLLLSEAIFLLTCSNILGLYSKCFGCIFSSSNPLKALEFKNNTSWML